MNGERMEEKPKLLEICAQSSVDGNKIVFFTEPTGPMVTIEFGEVFVNKSPEEKREAAGKMVVAMFASLADEFSMSSADTSESN
jgi:hypothetical protein